MSNLTTKTSKKKAKNEDTHSVIVRLELGVDEVLELDRFAFNIKKRCLKELKRNPKFGLQKLCVLSLELLVNDKEFRERMENVVMDHFKSQSAD